MVDMRRNVDAALMPRNEVLIHIQYPEQVRTRRDWWLVVDGGIVEIEQDDPGVAPDLKVTAELKAMTEIWVGMSTVGDVVAEGRMRLEGDPRLASTMQNWLGLSPFARESERPGPDRRRAA
jgi:hypothetical protein